MTVQVKVYVQVGDGAIQPMGAADGEDEADVRAGLAALFRSMCAQVDANAAFLETVLRYDEEDT